MDLTFGLKTPRDLLEKLKRDAILLDDEVTSDRFFNFVVTAYSLIDWIKNNPATTLAAQAARIAVVAMYNDRYIQVCGDLATASKHYNLTHRQPITSSATSDQGYGQGRYGKGGFGVGEEDIRVWLGDGSMITCLELAAKSIDAWDAFFAMHNL